MSINNLLERPIPPQPKGWGLLGQLVEAGELLSRENWGLQRATAGREPDAAAS